MTDLQRIEEVQEFIASGRSDIDLAADALLQLGMVYESVASRQWISVEEKLPEEHPSIFAPWFGTAKWNKAMWRTGSWKVIVTIRFKDGSRIVREGETHDGKWYTSISPSLEPVITHWMPMPEKPEESEDNSENNG